MLPDKYGVDQELYLHVNENEKKIPVPKLLWKILYNHESAKGVAVIGVNNPHLRKIPRSYILCKDICKSVKWLHLKRRTNIKEGYMYCCEMNQFMKATGLTNVFEFKQSKLNEAETM